MKNYIIIDVMEHNIYFFTDRIEMGFALDNILQKRDDLEIPYKLISYNYGKVISIRNGGF